MREVSSVGYQVSGVRARGAGTREWQVINRCRVSNLVFGSGRWRHHGQLAIPERPTRLRPLVGTYLICTWPTACFAFARALVACMLARWLSPVACRLSPVAGCWLLCWTLDSMQPSQTRTHLHTHTPAHPHTHAPTHPNTQTRLCSSSLPRAPICSQPCTGRCPRCPRPHPRRSLLPTCPARPSDVSALPPASVSS
jgi:hypothetical protein